MTRRRLRSVVDDVLSSEGDRIGGVDLDRPVRRPLDESGEPAEAVVPLHVGGRVVRRCRVLQKPVLESLLGFSLAVVAVEKSARCEDDARVLGVPPSPCGSEDAATLYPDSARPKRRQANPRWLGLGTASFGVAHFTRGVTLRIFGAWSAPL